MSSDNLKYKEGFKCHSNLFHSKKHKTNFQMDTEGLNLTSTPPLETPQADSNSISSVPFPLSNKSSDPNFSIVGAAAYYAVY